MSEEKQICPQISHFGAHYPDACCIDGYLWDLDSDDGSGLLNSGGEIPCPFCNTEAYIELYIDEEAGITRERILNEIEKLREKYQ